MINSIALAVGYLVMGIAAVVAVIAAIDVRWGRPDYRVLVLGFGPVWIDADKHAILCRNLRKAGYRLKRIGRWDVGFSVPGILTRKGRKSA